MVKEEEDDLVWPLLVFFLFLIEVSEFLVTDSLV